MLESIIYLHACFFVAVQVVLTVFVLKALVDDSADREDVFLLIPLFWLIPFFRLLADRIPKALKREPRK